MEIPIPNDYGVKYVCVTAGSTEHANTDHTMTHVRA